MNVIMCKDLRKDYKISDSIKESKICTILSYFMRINNLEYLKRELYDSKDEDVDLIYAIIQRCTEHELRELLPYFKAQKELDKYREYLDEKYGKIKINEVGEFVGTKEEEAKLTKLFNNVALLRPYDDHTSTIKYHVNNRSNLNDETIKNTKI